eukprot:47021-Chlamydomonas_euryale.AAC.1
MHPLATPSMPTLVFAAATGRPPARVLLPDARGVLSPAADLRYNDAEWLGAAAATLAHAALPHACAEALGCRSLRYEHEVGSRRTHVLPCPTLDALRERLGPAVAAGLAGSGGGGGACGSAAVVRLLWELAELADALGCGRMHVALDHRTHAAQSLLHTGLAQCQ